MTFKREDETECFRLTRQSSIRLTASTHPLPLVNIGKHDADWYEGITQKLKWNQSIGTEPDPLLDKSTSLTSLLKAVDPNRF